MIFKGFLLKLFSFFLLLFLFFKFGPSFPLSLVSQEKGEPLVAQGTGSKVAAPDTAKVSLGIEETGSLLNGVVDSVSKKSKALVSSLKGLGVDEKDIKTVNYQVFPVYSYEVSPSRIEGYRVQITYEVVVKEIDKVNQVLATAAENGANVIGGVSFELSEVSREKLLDEARKEAAEKAREKAGSLAKAAGVTLGQVLSVSEAEDGATPPFFLDVERVSEEVTPPEITPGESKVTVTVTLVFEIR